jgi:hypothetical protein
MHRQTLRTPTYFEQLAGYTHGPHTRQGRREAGNALRDEVTRRLGDVREQLREAARACLQRGALTEVAAIERVGRHVEKVAECARRVGTGVHGHETGVAGVLYEYDRALLGEADALAHRFDGDGPRRDFLAVIEQDLRRLERKLDERPLLYDAVDALLA